MAETVEEYLQGFPGEVRALLEQVRATIHQAVPGATETISYDVPAIQIDGHSVVYFAGWKKHLSVYPVPDGDAAFEAAIAPYRAGKGTLKFPLDKPIPYALIGDVAARLARRRGH